MMKRVLKAIKGRITLRGQMIISPDTQSTDLLLVGQFSLKRIHESPFLLAHLGVL
jgi:hypothetical protein